ncbi:MAG: hypothetical protein V4726_25190 [Verrucomicrobiota bacterium]
MNPSVLTGAFCLLGGAAGLGMAALWKRPGGEAPAPPPRQALVPSFNAATMGLAEVRALLRELPDPDPASALGRQAAWLERLKKADVAGMKDMLEDARRNADPYERRLYREMVFAKWIQENAEEAYAYSKVYDEGRVKAQFVFYWARANPDQAWETFLREGSTNYQFWTMGVVAEEAPGRYLDMLADPERARVMEDMDIFDAVLRDGKRGTQADAEKMLALKDQKKAVFGIEATCLLWARKDPEGAMQWARTIQDPERKQRAICGVIREMAERDPQVAVAEMRKVKGVFPPTLIREVTAGLVKNKLDSANSLLEIFGTEDRSSILLRGIFTVMDHPETRTVIPLLDKYWDPKAEPEDGANPLGALAKWVPEDASKEWSGLMDFPDSPARAALARVLAPQLARENPVAALTAAEQSKDPALRGILAGELVRNSIHEADEAGFLKAAALLEGKEFVTAVYDMTRELSENAPTMDKALEFANRQTGDTRMRAMEMVAWVWAERDPAAALTWSAGDAERMRGPFRQDLLARWARDDSYAASAWIDSLPAGAGRDSYTCGLVRNIASSEPDSAFSWTQTLTDPGLRLQWATFTVREWARHDAAAAWQAVEGAALDEPTRAALRDALSEKAAK